MGYDRGDSFPFDFEQNRIPFVSKSKGKLSPHHDHIAFNLKGNISTYICLSVVDKASRAVSPYKFG